MLTPKLYNELTHGLSALSEADPELVLPCLLTVTFDDNALLSLFNSSSANFFISSFVTFSFVL